MRAAVFLVLLSFNAHAFEVWSGEFHAETKDGATVGFVATFPMEEADCHKQVIRSTIKEFTMEQFETRKETIMVAANLFIKGRCNQWVTKN